jgi:uncharacterized membrane protein
MSLNFLGRLITGLLFIFAGVVHFVRPEFYEKIMPPQLPKHQELIFISGFFEIVGGIGLILPKVSKSAAWGLAALLVAVYPANIYHTIIRKKFPGFLGSPVYHAIRLPLQGLFIWWVLTLGKNSKPATNSQLASANSLKEEW